MNLEALEAIAWVRRACSTGEARKIRLAANVSCAEVGDTLGAGEQTVWRWESGVSHPRRESALAYARLLRRLADLDHLAAA